MRVDEAVARARAALVQAKSPYWHLLRLYTDATPLGERVTPVNIKDRPQPQIRSAQQEFLDAQAKSEVCPRERFVGRMQEIEAIWKAQMPQVPRAMMSLLGPGPNVWECAGRSASGSRGCETTPRSG